MPENKIRHIFRDGKLIIQEEQTWLDAYAAHYNSCEKWENGTPYDHWVDDDGYICIGYTNGKWWHYSIKNNEWTWW